MAFNAHFKAHFNEHEIICGKEIKIENIKKTQTGFLELVDAQT